MPFFLLLARYWRVGVFVALLGVIGAGKLMLDSRARVIASQRTEIEAAETLLAARALEKQALEVAIENQNARVEELRSAQVAASVESVERVRTVIVHDRKQSPKTAKTVKELNAWLTATFSGF